MVVVEMAVAVVVILVVVVMVAISLDGKISASAVLLAFCR